MSDKFDGVIPRSQVRIGMPVGAKTPRFLRIPARLPEVDDVLNTALRLELPEVIVLSQKEEGGLVWLANDNMTCERANWLLDMFKQFLLTAPAGWERKD